MSVVSYQRFPSHAQKCMSSVCEGGEGGGGREPENMANGTVGKTKARLTFVKYCTSSFFQGSLQFVWG